MAIVSADVIRGYFARGEKPTSAQFSDFIDTACVLDTSAGQTDGQQYLLGWIAAKQQYTPVPHSEAILGPASLNLASTTAVQVGTTPRGGRFIPAEFLLYCVSASAPSVVSAATLGLGVTGPSYNETFFSFLDPSFDTANVFYRYNLPAGASAKAAYTSNTAVFVKMATPITNGDLTAKVFVRGIIV